MDHGGHDILIKDAIVFLFAAGLIVPLLRAVRLPTVAGFILAGIALGPYGLAQFAHEIPLLEYVSISDASAAQPFAELGVLTLLFLLGLELSFEKLWALRRSVFGVGLCQALGSAAIISTIAVLLGLEPVIAIVIGLALALSSTAIVMQLLISNREATSPVGRTALGVLLLQDLLVAPILIFVGFIGPENGSELTSVLLQALVQGLLAVLVIVLIGRFLLARLFHIAVMAGGRELLLAMTLLTLVGAAVISGAAGLSIALGAFLAGLLLGETEFKHQIEVDLEPFKGLLLGLFFVTVGMSFDLAYLFANWSLVAVGVVSLILVKAFVAFVVVRLFSGSTPRAVESAFLLAPAGEFAFVILGGVMASGMFDSSIITLTTAVAGLSMLMIPAMWTVGRWLASRFEARTMANDSTDATVEEGHVIVAGFGRVGRTVTRILEQENTAVVGLDTNPTVVNAERKKGREVFLGDGAREEVLAKVGLENAAMVIITLDSYDAAERIVKAVRQSRPAIPVLVRAQDENNLATMYEAGATFVVPDAIESGLQLSARALELVGYETSAARSLLAAARDEAYALAPRRDEPNKLG